MLARELGIREEDLVLELGLEVVGWWLAVRGDLDAVVRLDVAAGHLRERGAGGDSGGGVRVLHLLDEEIDEVWVREGADDAEAIGAGGGVGGDGGDELVVLGRCNGTQQG